MIPERIGTMGRTQGVSASMMPDPKKKSRMAHHPESARSPAIRELSSPGSGCMAAGVSPGPLAATRTSEACCGVGG
jgi:hypothetical protein